MMAWAWYNQNTSKYLSNQSINNPDSDPVPLPHLLKKTTVKTVAENYSPLVYSSQNSNNFANSYLYFQLHHHPHSWHYTCQYFADSFYYSLDDSLLRQPQITFISIFLDPWEARSAPEAGFVSEPRGHRGIGCGGNNICSRSEGALSGSSTCQ